MEPSSVTHTHSITSKICALVTGLTADCYAQVQCTCYEANNFCFKYGCNIPVHVLAKCVADIGIICPFMWPLVGKGAGGS
eukprot:10487975-Ditylum_brightwellii.AAC.1